MALNPIRWDNIASPQFNNSGYAVAGAAFGEASEGAARFAKSMRDQEEARIAEQRKLATNAAIAKAMQDGTIDRNDLRGHDTSLVDMTTLGTYVRDSQANAAELTRSENESTAFQTENERNQQLIANNPLELEQEAAFRAAQQSLMSAQEERAKSAASAADYQRQVSMGTLNQQEYARAEQLRKTTGQSIFQKHFTLDEPGTVRYIAREEVLAEEAAMLAEFEAAGTTVTPEQLLQIQSKREEAIENNIAEKEIDPAYYNRIGLEANLTGPEIAQTTLAQANTRRETLQDTIDKESNAERQKQLKQHQKYVTDSAINSNVAAFNGKTFEFIAPSTATVNEITGRAKSLGVKIGAGDSEEIIEFIHNYFPNKKGLNAVLNHITEQAPKFSFGLGMYDTGVQFKPNAMALLGPEGLLGQIESARNAELEGTPQIGSGSATADYRNNIQSIVSGSTKEVSSAAPAKVDISDPISYTQALKAKAGEERGAAITKFNRAEELLTNISSNSNLLPHQKAAKTRLKDQLDELKQNNQYYSKQADDTANRIDRLFEEILYGRQKTLEN